MDSKGSLDEWMTRKFGETELEKTSKFLKAVSLLREDDDPTINQVLKEIKKKSNNFAYNIDALIKRSKDA